MENSLLSKLLLIPFVISTLISCGDSPLLSDEPSKDIRGIAGLESSARVELADLFIQPIFNGRPSVFGIESMVFLVFDKAGKLTSPNTDIGIKLWMPEHGHGSYPVDVKEISEGIYQANEIIFTMPGLWDLHFQLKRDGKVVSEVKWPYTL